MQLVDMGNPSAMAGMWPSKVCVRSLIPNVTELSGTNRKHLVYEYFALMNAFVTDIKGLKQWFDLSVLYSCLCQCPFHM